jgi:hypothetical protein
VTALERLLQQLPPDQALDFMRLMEAVYQVRFTGPITFDFFNGVPKQINLGQPVRLSICQRITPDGG